MLTFLPLEEIDEMSTWKDQRLNEAKEILAFELTKLVHGEDEATKAQEAARALFSGAADTEHMPATQLTEADLTDGSIGILTLMVKAGLAASNGEARRLVVQGGVLVDGEEGRSSHRQLHRRSTDQGHRHQEGQEGLPQR